MKLTVIVIVVRGSRSGEASNVPHKRLVMRPAGVVEVPTAMAEVVEATQVSAEVRSLLHATHRAEGVLQVRIYLDLLTEPGGLDLDKGRSHSLHVTSAVVEGDPSRANGVLELIRIQAGVDDASKQVIENHGEALGSHHAV